MRENKIHTKNFDFNSWARAKRSIAEKRRLGLFIFIFLFFSLARYWRICGVVISALQTPSPSSPRIRLSALQPFAIVFLLFLSSWPRRLLVAIGLCRRDEKSWRLRNKNRWRKSKFQFKFGWSCRESCCFVVGRWLTHRKSVKGWQLTTAKSIEIKSERIFSLRVFAFCSTFFNSVNNVLTFPWTCLCNINDCLVLSLFSSSSPHYSSLAPCSIRVEKSEEIEHNKRGKFPKI